VTYRLRARVSGDRREQLFERIWTELSAFGLQGIHEGTLLAEDAARMGLEATAWVVDSDVAPHQRDWLGQQVDLVSELYFPDEASAVRARSYLLERGILTEVAPPERVADQDWDAEWKKSYRGIEIPPHWEIVPPWEQEKALAPGVTRILLNPGAGFGTGTHETTQLCLEALGREGNLTGREVLDFGSGSGILSIAAARRGARVWGVEIDPLANENARENARLNGLEEQQLVFLSERPKREEPYSGVLANILKPVLLEHAQALLDACSEEGFLILSGLIESDVAQICAAFEPKRGRARVFAKGEWRAVVWQTSRATHE
jgi:ribosomal protein L11 methyltransferase